MASINIPIPAILKPLFTRDKSGNYNYTITDKRNWCSENASNLHLSQDHPLLTPAMLFVSKLYSQGQRVVRNKKTKEVVENHWLTNLLNSPNPYQTGMDLDEEQMWMMLAQGKAVAYLQRSTVGGGRMSEIDSIYFLDSDKIEYPEGFKTSMIRKSKSSEMMRQKIVYDKGGDDEKEIRMSDLLFFYDMPNGMNKNKVENESRIQGIRQVLINTIDAQCAKNIILKTNGKEILSGKGGSDFPLTKDEMDNAKRAFNQGYGLGIGRSRLYITKSDVNWKSAHVPLRDLGLDDSNKVDGNIIYTALHIPKDILSLEAKKTTYNNFKESMTSYIQNEIQPSAKAADMVYQKLLEREPDLEVYTSFDHMPIMQHVKKEQYETAGIRAESLKKLLSAGLPQEIALDLCGFDKNTKLEDIQLEETNSTQTEQDGSSTGNEEN